MPRNIERDEKEAMRRKEQLMEAGFRLFSQYGIENVSLQRVADAAEVGVATLYNYYQTKVKLVIAISGKIWGDLWKEILEEKGPGIWIFTFPEKKPYCRSDFEPGFFDVL